MAWLETVFYRFALKSTLAARRAEKQLAEIQRERIEASVDIHLESEEARVAAQLASVLERLPMNQRRGIELYFGVVGGRDHTVSEIATDLGCSMYHARAAVVMGLARLAGELEVQGELSDEEFEFVRAYFVEGHDLVSAEQRLGRSRVETRRLLKGICGKFSQVLRARTVITGKRV